jgi:Tol biopolymer transport system component
MRRTLLILILATMLSACQSAPVQAIQTKWRQSLHPCPSLLYPGDPVWSMDSTKIAYASLPQSGTVAHFAIDLSSRRISQLTVEANDTVHGVKGWSQDDAHLIVVTAIETKLLSTNGTGAMNGLSIAGQARWASWSPAGDQILFISYRRSLDYALFVGSPMKKDWTPILADSSLDAAVWSPDAKRIAYLRSSTYQGDLDLAVVNADGTGLDHLTEGANIVGAPYWSPDGTQIAFLNRGGVSLNVINVDGTGLRTLTTQAGWPFVWGADGQELIAYQQTSNSPPIQTGNIVKVDLTGKTTVLTTITALSDIVDWTPVLSFSPDGSKVVFIRGDTPFPDIYMMNVDGTDLVRLTHNPGYQTCLDWPF